MRWIYQLQQRVAITKQESTVILVLVLLFGVGLTTRHLQRQPVPVPEEVYAETDRLFEEGASLVTIAAASVAVAEALPFAEVGAPDEAETAERPRYASKKKALPPSRMNLNTATASQLERLPRIGPKMAARILAYREAHGGFRSVEELVQVRGIGEKTLAKMAPYLYVE